MNKIKCAIVGTGYMSDFHIDALRRISFVEINAITDINYELAKKKAAKYSLPKFS